MELSKAITNISLPKTCGVVSLVTNSLVRTFYRNVWQVIFAPTFCKRTASTLRECSCTNTTSDVLPVWRSAASFQSGR